MSLCHKLYLTRNALCHVTDLTIRVDADPRLTTYSYKDTLFTIVQDLYQAMLPPNRSTRSTLLRGSLNAIVSRSSPTLALAATSTPIAQAVASELELHSPKNTAQKKTRFKPSEEQLAALEQVYLRERSPSMAARRVLANDTNLELQFINIWFQNKRQTAKKNDTTGRRLRRRETASRRPSYQPVVSSPLAQESFTEERDPGPNSETTFDRLKPHPLDCRSLNHPTSNMHDTSKRSKALPGLFSFTPLERRKLPLGGSFNSCMIPPESNAALSNTGQHTLEWACNNDVHGRTRKRSRTGPIDTDDGRVSSGSDRTGFGTEYSTEVESDEKFTSNSNLTIGDPPTARVNTSSLPTGLHVQIPTHLLELYPNDDLQVACALLLMRDSKTRYYPQTF
ncbi:hypothetical protein BD410DRAFT_894226 [Rickenella mellea]|uniref:Homeobox domain-containing protein n=1 Tax=Rickenella mellea TaxID=50990 RepID=A0A4Y7QKD8_9AGAM|nr:hypothetical protein BD410DRAFT_894226 [Rickenella mellea]